MRKGAPQKKKTPQKGGRREERMLGWGNCSRQQQKPMQSQRVGSTNTLPDTGHIQVSANRHRYYQQVQFSDRYRFEVPIPIPLQYTSHFFLYDYSWIIFATAEARQACYKRTAEIPHISQSETPGESCWEN
jgi:hypothetical protein